MAKRPGLFGISLILVCSCTAQTTISVLDFQAEGISSTEASVLTNRFRAELVNIGTYSVIERAAMEEVLKEQGFQQSGCVTTECVVEVGQLLGAQQMVGGSIGRVADVFSVTARVINVQTGEIISVTTYDQEGDLGSLLKTGMRQVALDLFSREAVASVKATMNTGDLFIATQPEGAELILDGRSVGYAPLLIEKLIVGKHQIQVKQPGHLSHKTSATVIIDQTDTVKVTLISVAGIQARLDRYKLYKRRYFMSSVVASVVGGVFMLTADKSYENYQTARQDVDKIYYRVKIQDSLSAVLLGAGATAAVSAAYLQIREAFLANRLKREG